MASKAQSAKGALKTTALFVLMLLVGLGGYYTLNTDGLALRDFAKRTQEIVFETKKDTLDLWEQSCKVRYPNSQYCKIGADKPATVAIIGDSRANHFFYGLAKQYDLQGDNLVNLGLPACVPLVGVNSVGYWRLDACSSVLQGLFEKVANDPQIHTVILAAVWHNHIVNSHFYPQAKQIDLKLESPLFPKETPSGVIFEKQLQKTIDFFSAHHKKVILIKQMPELDFDPVGCAVARYRNLVPSNATCTLDTKVAKLYLQEYETVFDTVARANPNITVWDPQPIFCDERYCQALLDGRSLYADDYHLSKLGSHFFAQKIWGR